LNHIASFRFVALGAVLSSTLLVAAEAVENDRPPNIVLIMVDDLGYYDLGCYGHPSIKTPVLDQLAKDGVRLTSFYSGSTICTPSRMALMTGAYAPRVGWTQGVLGYKMDWDCGMNPKALTIAEVFKSAGYATGMTGKWHLGDPAPCLPNGQGFDYSYYITKSNNQTKKLWRDGELLENPFDNRMLTEQFTKEAVQFIKANKENPFFLYVPYTAPHFPVQAHPDWKGKSEFGEYGDVVEELDSSVGEILTTLKDAKIEENTIVVFLSDNGPQAGQAARADPFRGLKFSALEGGNRVACIIQSKGTLPAGRVSDALIGAIDLMPTLCHACGIDLDAISTESPKIDGVNVWDTLMGKDVEHPRNDLLFWSGLDGFQAIRVGDWKLFLDREAAARPHKRNSDELNAKILALAAGEGPVLFHLADENTELTDFSAKYPERVKQMKTLAAERLEDILTDVLPLVK
jgi:arylsulfatase A